jgi:hypothetical protein
MAARRQGVNAATGRATRNAQSNSNIEFDLPLSVSICVYLWIHSAKSHVAQIYEINHSNDGGVDRRIWTADGSHCGKTFGSEQDAVANACAHRVKRENRIAAIRAVELKRLDNEDLSPFVRRHFLRGDYIADDAANQHAWKCRGQR